MGAPSLLVTKLPGSLGFGLVRLPGPFASSPWDPEAGAVIWPCLAAISYAIGSLSAGIKESGAI